IVDLADSLAIPVDHCHAAHLSDPPRLRHLISVLLPRALNWWVPDLHQLTPRDGEQPRQTQRNGQVASRKSLRSTGRSSPSPTNERALLTVRSAGVGNRLRRSRGFVRERVG
ncbi:MAG: hypothetical protein M3319_07435, partial [Actinomycetota bacterium]|nr:hypothetical protein [Actinomycetota bacterium]